MDKRIQKILKSWKNESGATRVIQFKYRNGILEIFTSQPGWLIGKAGVLVDKYTEILKRELHDFKELKFIETSYYWV